ncbi:MAG: GFA family protein [Alphaproteobacteria bacterium]|nr:GFA family protein [Alphaproteobacteria bacterium]
MSDNHVHLGGCLCGGVRYQVDGPLRPVVACHCSQCRKTSGHFAAMTSAPRDRITILSDETLTWFDSSPEAKRGFCSRCGGNVFWIPRAEDRMSITAGTLDMPTGLTLSHHIFTEDAGDYYEV